MLFVLRYLGNRASQQSTSGLSKQKPAFSLINKLCKLSLLPELAMSPLIMQLTTMDLEIRESMSWMFQPLCPQDSIIFKYINHHRQDLFPSRRGLGGGLNPQDFGWWVEGWAPGSGSHTLTCLGAFGIIYCLRFFSFSKGIKNCWQRVIIPTPTFFNKLHFPFLLWPALSIPSCC